MIRASKPAERWERELLPTWAMGHSLWHPLAFGNGKALPAAVCRSRDDQCEDRQLNAEPEEKGQDNRSKQRAEQAAFQSCRFAFLPPGRNLIFESFGKIRHHNSFRVGVTSEFMMVYYQVVKIWLVWHVGRLIDLE